MQTFITDRRMNKSAANLDWQRLGKQRVEAVQIARTLAGLSSGWKNHPAVRMWKGYEAYLVDEYLYVHLLEWGNRGYNGEKCWLHFYDLMNYIDVEKKARPPWITDELILSHRSNLVRKLPHWYGPLWPGVPSDLPYVWPR